MNHNSLLTNRNGWFTLGGPDNDIIISSRIRLSRNLTGHLFPGSMGWDEEQQVKTDLLTVFSKMEQGRFHVLPLEELRPPERRLLLERKFISQDFSLNKEKTMLLSDDQAISCMINEEDHLKMIGFSGGSSLDKLYKKMRVLDDNIEKEIDFAASIEYGYLGPRLDNLGTAMKASFLVHLPALEETGLIDKALKTMLQVGYSVTGFAPDDEDGSLGQYYLVSNQETLGISEEDIIEKMETLSNQLITYERMARKDLSSKKLVHLEDRIFRAQGVVERCRLLSYEEGVQILSSLRLGIALGLLPYEMGDLNSLIITSQNSHIQEKISRQDIQDTTVEMMRANLFKELLVKSQKNGGASDV